MLRIIKHKNNHITLNKKYVIRQISVSIQINSIKFEAEHEYWVEYGKDIYDPDNWLEPIDNPNKNIDIDYILYNERRVKTNE